MSSYAVAPLFLIRAAGVSFEHLEHLATDESAKLARELLVRQREFAASKAAVEQILRHRGHGLSEEAFRAWRKALRGDTAPDDIIDLPSQFQDYVRLATQLAAKKAELNATFARELNSARQSLFESAHSTLPHYLIFAGPGAQELRGSLAHWRADSSLSPRNARAGDRERHIFLYL
ncbi:MAG TPA: hypothetical protein VGC85_06865, partial [Chthoniobacterales bacterium]